MQFDLTVAVCVSAFLPCNESCERDPSLRQRGSLFHISTATTHWENATAPCTAAGQSRDCIASYVCSTCLHNYRNNGSSIVWVTSCHQRHGRLTSSMCYNILDLLTRQFVPLTTPYEGVHGLGLRVVDSRPKLRNSTEVRRSQTYLIYFSARPNS